MTPDELKEIEQFAAEIVEYERTHADPARDAAEDAEWTRLQAQYPGQFVAYLDSWDGKMFTKHVLAHGASYRAVRDQLVSLSDAELETIVIGYIDPPNAALCTRLQTGEIKVTDRAGQG